jgi:urease accessory protein
MLCDEPDSATVTNDIFTREDQEFLIRNRALPAERILAIETGGCPHAAIREDISANAGALETLQAKFGCQILFVESGGDNLAANYSRELADFIVYVIDVSVRSYFYRKSGGFLTLLFREETRYHVKEGRALRTVIFLSSTRYITPPC